MHPRLLLAAFLVAAGPLCGSAVYYSSCSVAPIGSPLVTQSGAGYCFLAASIYSIGDFQLTGMAYDASELPAGGSIAAVAQIYNDAGEPDPPLNYQITSRAYETFETRGPLRAGIIQVDLGQENYHDGVSEVGISDGIHTYEHGPCLDVLNPRQNSCSTSYTAPFELGKPFSALSYIDESGNTLHGTPVVIESSAAVVSFTLFEADGVTPVDFTFAPDGTPGVPVDFTPEPSTLAMFGLIFVFGIASRLRGRGLWAGNGVAVRPE